MQRFDGARETTATTHDAAAGHENAHAAGASAAPRRSRRGVLLGGAATLASGAAGMALGYRFRTEIRDVKLRAMAWPLEVPAEMDAFRIEAARIETARAQQTADDVRTLKKRYETEVFGRVRMSDLVERLALCIDPSDRRLFCGSQLLHAHQVYAAMQANGVADPDMLLLGLIHDLGKILLLAHEAPESVVGVTSRIVGGEPGAGLDGAIYQFGHGEFLYSRIVGLVPEHVAWVTRWHNIDPAVEAELMTPQERTWTERWLVPFQRFDGGFVSPYYLPKVDLARCRDLVERAFPSPVVV
ncbi:inositol oxygenase [Candidatus Binatia bacterium]|nr:inositol oxygenase [Candidatus Binatia bacterium]